MKKILVSILLLAASAAFSSCVMDKGGNYNLNAYRLKEYACYLVEHSAIVSVSAMSQMVLDKRDINAEGFTAKASDGILFTRTEQDCWAVTGQNEVTSFSLTLVRVPATDGYDRWICRDVQALHEEGADGSMKMWSDGDILFEWVTHVYTISISSSLEQTGIYQVDFFAGSRTATRTDWCTLTYDTGNLAWVTSRGGGGDIYYE